MDQKVLDGLADLVKVRTRALDEAARYDDDVREFMEHVLLYRNMNVQTPDDWAHRNYYDMVATLSPGPKRVALTLPEGYEVMEPQQCFRNAWNLVMDDPTLLYCEGFAQARGLVLEHAWVEDEHGTIIDPTWTNLTDDDLTHATYLGIRMSAELEMRLSARLGWASWMNADMENDNKLLQYGFKMHDGIAIDIQEGAL